MPMYELAIPVSAGNLKVTHNGVDYNLVESVFTDPDPTSTKLTVVSNHPNDDTQNIVIYGIVAGVEVSKSVLLDDTTPVDVNFEFTEVFEAYLDAVCEGIITIKDSLGTTLGTIPVGRRVLSPDVFKRVGKDGVEAILPLNGGCEFVGEVLPGEWKKDWDADISVFTARINGVVTGMLEMGGKSLAAGTLRYGWLNNHHPFVMMNDAEMEVEMEIPTSDTGAAAGDDIFFDLHIRRQKELIGPDSDGDFIRTRIFVDENGLVIQLHKRIAGAATVLLWDGSTADGNSSRDPAADKFWIFRFVFHDGHAGEAAPADDRHMHVYATHAAARAGLATATEEELFDTVGGQASPYDISDLLFKVGYPAYQIISAHTTWFGSAVGSGNEAISTYMRTSYPALFALKYDFEDASYGDGDVELWDQKGSAVEADWQQVFDEDHDFAGKDVVLQNGLIRVYIDEGADRGLALHYYDGSTWVFIYYFRPTISGAPINYPYLTSINQVSPERTSIKVKLSEAALSDVFAEFDIVLKRGSFAIEVDPLNVNPLGDIGITWEITPPLVRHAYLGDDGVGDAGVTGRALGAANAVFTDSFMNAFNHEDTFLISLFSNMKPAGGVSQRNVGAGGYLRIMLSIAMADIVPTKTYATLTYFPLAAGLFLEAEDGTIAGGAARYFGEPAVASTFVRARSDNGADNQTLTIIGDVGGVRTKDTITLAGAAWVNGSVDFTRVYMLKLSAATLGNIEATDSLNNPIHIIPAATTHVDNAVVLVNGGESVSWNWNAGTDLPAGRYLTFFRLRDTAQSPNDVRINVRNATDTEERIEENAVQDITVTAAYLYYGFVTDILEGDVAGLDAFQTYVWKLAAVNTIYVDYFLIVPIGDGEDWPQDLAHSALRTFDKPRRIYVR